MSDNKAAQRKSALHLEKAIDGLYKVFRKYPLHDHVAGCPCCVDDEDGACLHSKPLCELSSDDLSRYAFKAITTWGTEADFKHFLPRLFELVTDEHSITTETDCEVMFGKLTYTNWHQWLYHEQSAINNYFISLWRFLLEEPPQCVNIDDFLCGIAQVADDMTPYLLTWQQTILPSAVSHFLDFVDWNTPTLQKGRLTNSFWSGRRIQMDEVVSWALDSSVTEQFGQNLEACVFPLQSG